MQDRKHDIIQDGLAVLREHGYTGFTQPRIAERAGLRQSHLTYYYPTRLDLLEAVGRTAIERQLAAVDATLGGHASLEAAAAEAFAAVVTRHENTRVFMALAQAGDEEPRLRELFRELADGIVARVARFWTTSACRPCLRSLPAFCMPCRLGLRWSTSQPDDRTARSAPPASFKPLSMIAGKDARRAAPAPIEGEPL